MSYPYSEIMHHPPPSLSKLSPKFLSSHLRQRKITDFAKKNLFENLFPPTAERGGRNYDLLYQHSIRKCKDELEQVSLS